MVGIQNQISFGNIFADTGFFLPRQLKQSIDVVAHDGRFRRHRRHHFQFFQFRQTFFFSLFAHACFFDFCFQRVQLAAFVFFAQFFLNRFHLLIQVILALGFFHLTFHAATDAFLDLHDVEFGFQLSQQKFQTLNNAGGLQHILTLLQFQLQMGGNRIGKTAVVIDTADGTDDFGRDFFVQFRILLKLSQQGTAQGLNFGIVLVAVFINRLNMGQKQSACFVNRQRARTTDTFYQHFNGTIRQLQNLQNLGNRTGLVQIFSFRVFCIRVKLGQQENRIIISHCRLKGCNRFRTTDEQRQYHMRIHHDIA